MSEVGESLKTTLEKIGKQAKARSQRKQLSEMQLLPFPAWPDDRRGAPNGVIRSAIFGVVGKGKRRRVAGPVATSV